MSIADAEPVRNDVRRLEAVSNWAPRIGVKFYEAMRLVRLCETAEKIQVACCNGDAPTSKGEKACEAFEEYANSFGFSVDWPGIYPVMEKDGVRYHMPEYDGEPLEVVEDNVIKVFRFTLARATDEYVHQRDTNKWHHSSTIKAELEADFEEEEKYDHRVDIEEVYDNLFRHIPGLMNWNFYSEFTIQVSMTDLENDGWDEDMLRTYVTVIANWVDEGRMLRSEFTPYIRNTHDIYGQGTFTKEFGHFVVPKHPDLEWLDLSDEDENLNSRHDPIPTKTGYNESDL